MKSDNWLHERDSISSEMESLLLSLREIIYKSMQGLNSLQ